MVNQDGRESYCSVRDAPSLRWGRPMADGEGPSIGGNIEQGGLLSDYFKLNVLEGSSSTQAYGSMQGLGSLPQAMADGEGPAEKSSKKLAPFFFPKQVAALFKK
ncbi:hypothetical protein Q3G72_011948 [Acer saccharum]|nr:hypothetical protein Q3G72_002616 [Acer saccharum]KAK1591699.1 hypothetical protein Q3G72_011948 [Acer saccharum]